MPRSAIIDGTHIKASANKKKFQKKQVEKTAKIYSEQLREEVNAEREKLGKKAIEDSDDNNNSPSGGETVEHTESTTDPDCGMFVKGEHERQFAYEAHTVCDNKGFVLGVKVTAGNIHDSIAWDNVYDEVTQKYDVEFVAMDAGYKTPWIAKKILDDNKVPVLPYTRYNGNSEHYRPWEYTYDAMTDEYICPQGEHLRHTTTDRNGKKKGKRYSPHTFGKNIWIWLNKSERQSVARKSMQNAKKRLNACLRMPRVCQVKCVSNFSMFGF